MDSINAWLDAPVAFARKARCSGALRILTKARRVTSGLEKGTDTIASYEAQPDIMPDESELFLGVTAVDAKQCDLSFRQINRKMISILRHFVECELTNN